MKARTIVAIAAILFAGNSRATDDVELQASSLFNIYQTTCMKYLTNMDNLRDKLKVVPKLPPDKASSFLHGMAGNAWPVPDKYGVFVLAVPDGKNLCMVFGRRADAALVEEKFIRLFDQAPAPLVSYRVKDERIDTQANGPVHTLAYTWSKPDGHRKMLFTLSTATNPDAQLQATISAAITSD